MSELNSNVIYENNQVVFSKEILEYFESIKTEKNKEWIEKYFQVLSDTSNINSEKYNVHHIRPCFTFKNENHKNRKETQKLGDNFNSNKIKLSIYNHVMAHYYLWKIYNDYNSKLSFQRMCGQSQYKNNLTENELMEIAKLKEECAKKNQTKEERKEQIYKYNHSETRKFEMKKRSLIRYFDPIVKDYVARETILRRIRLNENKYANIFINNLKTTTLNSEEYNKIMIPFKLNKKKTQQYMNKVYTKEWILKNKDKIRKREKEYYNKYKDRRKELNNKLCFDPIKNSTVTYGGLLNRKKRNKELYKNIVPKECIIDE